MFDPINSSSKSPSTQRHVAHPTSIHLKLGPRPNPFIRIGFPMWWCTPHCAMLLVTSRCHGGCGAWWGMDDVVHNGRTNTSLQVEAHVPHHHTCMGREVGFVHCISLTMTGTNIPIPIRWSRRSIGARGTDGGLLCKWCFSFLWNMLSLCCWLRFFCFLWICVHIVRIERRCNLKA